MEYDRILKWDDRDDCATCAGWLRGDGCREWETDLNQSIALPCRLYADLIQLSGLIEEAEAGYPANAETGYGGYEGLWACEESESSGGECVLMCKFQNGPRVPARDRYSIACSKSNITPFRGIKGEPQVFPTAEDSTVVAKNATDQNEEYITVKRTTIKTLSQAPGLNAEVFLQMYKTAFHTDMGKGATVHPSGDIYPYIDELLRLGFIERKVDDPTVKLGSYYKHKGDIFKATWCGIRLMTFISMLETDVYLSGGKLVDAESAKGCKLNYTCKLSEIVGKDRLSEFTPCKVSITVTE